MIKIEQIKLPIKHKQDDLESEILKKLRIREEQLISYEIVKRSLDARKKPHLYFVYVVHVKTTIDHKFKKNWVDDLSLYTYPKGKEKASPIIIGFGPAGMFAAYVLAKAGLKPIVLERGEDVDARTETVEKFWNLGELNENSNVQFGEGGAGAFSDGKLTTRSKDPRAQEVMRVLVDHGGPEEILYVNKPHVGTDVLKGVVKSIREHIKKLGGKIYFNTRVDDLILEGNQIKGVHSTQGDFYSEHVILAIGHSARDTYEMLYEKGLGIDQKPFAMGVRIEHLQEIINLNQYGDLNAAKILGAADYKLTHTCKNERSVYSFCVCPGGMVVASASEEGGLVVNGMSEHARDQKNINGALLVQINTDDYESDHPLAGVYFQRKYEKMAFDLLGNYKAPIQTVGSFVYNEPTTIHSILPSYRPDTRLSDLSQCLPSYVVESLREGIQAFGQKIVGFDNKDVILTGIETRSSAPIRMMREFTSYESNLKGLYPAGEGAGYAGGIVSSAIDGMKIGEIVANK
ncbi:MAG: hypothetical protein JXR88_00515 [Clostridia bacterium]|nr:hypothetical protein [Clostridia bacterium]